MSSCRIVDMLKQLTALSIELISKDSESSDWATSPPSLKLADTPKN